MGEERTRDNTPGLADCREAPARESARLSPRRVFRDMVKEDIEERPLRWSRRRALVRYGESLGIDPFETRLIIRAVEYECGHVRPAAMADVDTPANEDYVASLRSREKLFHIALAILIGVLLGLAVLGLE